MARISLSAAVDEVASRDPDLKHVVDLAGPMTYRPRSDDGPFGALARAIVFQQLAGAAANAILGRVVTAAGGSLAPEAILALSDEELRAAGLSHAKIASLKDLSTKVLDASVDLTPPLKEDDDAVVKRLSTVRGIGPWTAEMYLMFELRRLDVWPVDDLGVRQGWAAMKGLAEPPKPKELKELGEPYRPYRSILAWYCWQAAFLKRGGTDLSLR
jgi:DNA-3-methyladenine glycosylase II